MKILSWNCRELRNQPAIDVLSQLVREKAPKILFLMEIKQSMEEMRQLQADLPYCCMLATLNHIDALILTDPQTPQRLTGFYGWLEEQNKLESWRLLRHLHSRSLVPWICCGDFNEILSLEEK